MNAVPPFLSIVVTGRNDDFGGDFNGRFFRSRCFIVDLAYHDALSLNPRLQFQEFIAKNVGIRRARGSFLLTTNTDIFLSRGVIARLASRSLERGILYRATRYDLKSHSDVSRLD